MLNFIPWVEEARDNQHNWIRRGLQDWSKACDTAIISTNPGRAAALNELYSDVPELAIIPGLKPNGSSDDMLPALDSVSGWRAVAEEVRRIAEATESSRVLLEMEEATLAYRNGNELMNPRFLLEGLNELPSDLDYIFYPSIKAHGFGYFGRHKALCEYIVSVLGDRVRFTDRSVESPDAMTDWWMAVKAHRTLAGISMTPPIPMVYVYEEGKIRWPSEQLPEVFRHIEREWDNDSDVILYPGGSNWNAGAKEIVPALCMYRDLPY